MADEASDDSAPSTMLAMHDGKILVLAVYVTNHVYSEHLDIYLLMTAERCSEKNDSQWSFQDVDSANQIEIKSIHAIDITRST